MVGVIGRKLGMTQIYREDGEAIPVTLVEVGPCYVTQVKTPDQDGYSAVQVGYEVAKESRLTKPQLGHLRRNDLPPVRRLIEFRVPETEEYVAGEELGLDLFSVGDRVHVRGISRGKGFQGMVKRHGASGGDETHGTTTHRAPGSIGASADPARVWRGKRLPGQTGRRRVTVRNLEVASVDADRRLLFLRGAVPGSKGGEIVVVKAREVG